MTNFITNPAHRAIPIQHSNLSTIETLDQATTPQGQQAKNMLEQARQHTASSSRAGSASASARVSTPFTPPAVARQALPGMDKQEDDATSRKNSGLLSDLKKIGWYLLTGETGSGDDSLRRELNSKIDELNQQVKTQQLLIEQLSQWLAAQSSAMAATSAPGAAPIGGTAAMRTSMPDSPAGRGMDKFDREEKAHCQRVVNGACAMKKMRLSSDELVTQDSQGMNRLKDTAELQAQQQRKYAELSVDDQQALKDALANKKSRDAMYQVGKPYNDEWQILNGNERAQIHVNAALKQGLHKLVGADNTNRTKPHTADQNTQTNTPNVEKATQTIQPTPSSSESSGTDSSA